MNQSLIETHLERRQVSYNGKSQEVENMKKLLIIIGAICYVVSPDLFTGPLDDAMVFLGSIIYAACAVGAERDRDPEYIKMERDF